VAYFDWHERAASITMSWALQRPCRLLLSGAAGAQFPGKSRWAPRDWTIFVGFSLAAEFLRPRFAARMGRHLWGMVSRARGKTFPGSRRRFAAQGAKSRLRAAVTSLGAKLLPNLSA